MIESVNNDKVKYWTKLSDKKYQDLENKFIIEGEHLVEEAFKSNHLLEVIALEDYKSSYPNTTYVSPSVMKKITSLSNPPKIIGISKKLTTYPIEGNILLLDGINNPGNLGTIIRSAVAFNINTIILSEDTCSIYNPKVVRATEGLLYHLNIREENLLDIIPRLKQDGYRIYSTNVEKGNLLNKTNFQPKTAIIMGNEGRGVKEEISNLADEYLYIKMNPDCESLNVGVATSIILYELNR